MRALLAVVAVGAVVLTGCSGDPADPPDAETPRSSPDESATAPGTAPTTTPDNASGPLQAEDVVTGLTSPWGLIAFDDGSILLSERDTTDIKLVPAGGGEPTVVATIDEAMPDGEAGLLGLATTPAEDRVFVYYTADDDNRIATMTWNGRRLGEPEVIFDGIPNGAGNRHEGGGLEVGPDNLLYVTTGETGDTPELAQDRDSLGGKVLRLTLDGEPAPGNPFDSAVYSWGHRNVEGLAFDDRGRLWVSEFGDSAWDELNLIQPGANYGWPEVEGIGDDDRFVNPEAVWAPENNSPAGLTFWEGSLWMAGLRGETLWEIPLEGARAAEPVPHFQGEYGRLGRVEVGAEGWALLLARSI
ncbi:MAG: PQQ-dependent sugar dehydrogenase, partial [Actinomycetota bacterium]|nr:PQQ-dependent sugar dehydrogenase [Actinomycetota bacterium]